MINGLTGIRGDLEAVLPQVSQGKNDTSTIQKKVSEYVNDHPSLQGSPISFALAQTVARGMIPRSREEFETFQANFMHACIDKIRATSNPRQWSWLEKSIKSTKPYEWNKIERNSQLAYLSVALEDPSTFVNHVKLLVQTNKTQYLQDPRILPSLKNPLLLEALILEAASSPDEGFKHFVKDFFVDHYLYSRPQEEDPRLSWLSLQSKKRSPLLLFFQKVGVLDEENNIRVDVVSLKEPIRMLQHFLNKEHGAKDISFDYENLETLNRQMKEFALYKFSKLLGIYLTSHPTNTTLLELDEILNQELPLNQKISRLQKCMGKDFAYPQLREVLNGIFGKNAEEIEAALAEIHEEQGLSGFPSVRKSALWKVKDSWRLEKARHANADLISFIKSVMSDFFSRLSIPSPKASLAIRFMQFSILWKIFAEGLMEKVDEIALDPFYKDLVRLAFKDKNVPELFRLADLITYQKYLHWVKDLPANHAFKNRALKCAQNYERDKLTCKEKLERALFQLETSKHLLTSDQSSQAAGLLNWMALRSTGLMGVNISLPFLRSSTRILDAFKQTNPQAKESIQLTHRLRDSELKELKQDAPFQRFLKKTGFFSQDPALFSPYLLDQVPLYKLSFLKRMELHSGLDLSGIDLSLESINKVAYFLILTRFHEEILPLLPLEVQETAYEILHCLTYSPEKRIEELKKRCNIPEVIEALTFSFSEVELPNSVLQTAYQEKEPIGPFSFLPALRRAMNIEKDPEKSLEEHLLEESSLIQFFAQSFVREGELLGLNTSEDLQKIDLLNLQDMQNILEKLLWTEYQNKIKSLASTEQGVSQLLATGPEIGIEKSINKIRESSLRSDLKQELINLLSFEPRIQKMDHMIDTAWKWLKHKTDLYHLPIDPLEFAPDRTGYQKWSTVKRGIGIFFAHIKQKVEKLNLSPDYLLFLEATLLVHEFKASDRLLEEIEENSLEWDERV